jgi:hypothetical protein
MDAKERQPLRDGTKPPDKKRRRIGRRILRVLLILFVVIVLGLSIALYNPVRTVASLTRVNDYPLFVMKCTRNSPAPRGAWRPTGPWRYSKPPSRVPQSGPSCIASAPAGFKSPWAGTIKTSTPSNSP